LPRPRVVVRNLSPHPLAVARDFIARRRAAARNFFARLRAAARNFFARLRAASRNLFARPRAVERTDAETRSTPGHSGRRILCLVLHILGRSGKGVEHILRGVSAKCPPRHSSRERRMLPARFPATWPLRRSLPAQQTQPPPTHIRCEPISRRRRRHGDGRRGGPWASWRVRHPKCCNGRQGKEMQGKSMYALRGVVSGGVRRGRIGLPLASLVPLPFRGPKYSIQYCL
jgi:hypothetical protein